ncbi:hypothetical protein PA598K_05787 [Paenibacillus sp. 598K]|uniref:glycosyl hydrolase family 28-related protein n=1 Tax=Paenibacillus sp. 598K TaxID=1117987 RepID=UPI000FFA0135|nr:glycosyl hydrolase family 28-related protein [Paenibacillus sp. 598K]GBF77251.1 hypothetical protein PA598K_05787 [Paenibacillus sp. 598K]
MAIDRAALSLAKQAKVKLDNASVINVKDYGATGEASQDATEAFKAAMAACGMRHALFIPAGDYRIREPIINNASRIYGEAKYVDSGKRGTRLLFDLPRTAANDMKACLHFDKGSNLHVEHLTITGTFTYNHRNLDQYINKELFDQRKIEMFEPGLCAIHIDYNCGAVILDNVSTGSIKCGVWFNNRTGHITLLDCSIGGLFGLYVRKNTGDFFVMGGTLRGDFCGVLLGDVGANLEMIRVHMGFAPYGFFQVNDGQIDSGAELNRKGMVAWQFHAVKFEQIGECAIDLLPDSYSWASSIDAYGFSWSRLVDDGGWFFCMPDSLVSPADKQKYAIKLGDVDKVRIMYDYTTSLPFTLPDHRRNVPGEKIVSFRHLMEDCIFESISDRFWTYATKSATSRVRATPIQLYEDAISLGQNAITSGNLVHTNPATWDIRYGTVEPVTLAQLPEGLAITDDIIEIYGANPPLYKFVPDAAGTNDGEVGFNFVQAPDNSNYRDWMYYRGFFAMTNINAFSTLAAVIEGQDLTTGQWLVAFPQFNQRFQQIEWRKAYGNQYRRLNTRYRKAKYMSSDRVNPFYFIPPTVSLVTPRPYSPTLHAYSRDDLEIASGKSLILNATDGSGRYKITVDANGVKSTKL